MYTTIKCLGKCAIQTNPSKFDERLFSDIYLQIKFETRKRNAGFYVLRQGVPERHSTEGDARFCCFCFCFLQQVKPWSWHVELFLKLV